MKVIILTTEFPPRIIGELSSFVDFIARSVSNEGLEVHVITFDNWRSGVEVKGSVRINYVSNKVEPHLNPFTWASSLSCEYIRALSDLIWDHRGFDLVHAFEWSSALPIISLKEVIRIPYIQSFLSLEEQRSHSNLSLLGQTIKWVESISTSLADVVVAHSDMTYSALRMLYPWCASKLYLLDVNNRNFVKELIRVYQGVVEKHG
ncbi:MAG: glycosyltransferase [Thermoproteota archaeon]